MQSEFTSNPTPGDVMSQPVQPFHTFRDPALSLWQSALHQAITRRAAKADEDSPVKRAPISAWANRPSSLRSHCV